MATHAGAMNAKWEPTNLPNDFQASKGRTFRDEDFLRRVRCGRRDAGVLTSDAMVVPGASGSQLFNATASERTMGAGKKDRRCRAG